jgi:hypothetical protein
VRPQLAQSLRLIREAPTDPFLIVEYEVLRFLACLFHLAFLHIPHHQTSHATTQLGEADDKRSSSRTGRMNVFFNELLFRPIVPAFKARTATATLSYQVSMRCSSPCGPELNVLQSREPDQTRNAIAIVILPSRDTYVRDIASSWFRVPCFQVYAAKRQLTWRYIGLSDGASKLFGCRLTRVINSP